MKISEQKSEHLFNDNKVNPPELITFPIPVKVLVADFSIACFWHNNMSNNITSPSFRFSTHMSILGSISRTFVVWGKLSLSILPHGI